MSRKRTNRPARSPGPSSPAGGAPGLQASARVGAEALPRPAEDSARARALHLAAVLGLVGLAFLLRWVYLTEFSPIPFFDALVLDEKNYDEYARRILKGEPLGPGPLTMNPLGPMMVALVYRIFGEDLWAARVVQAVVDTGTCVLLYFLAAQLFDRRAGLVSLALAALYGPFIFYAGNLVAETWSIFFTTASFVLLMTPAPSKRRVGVAGFLFGVAILGRPNLVLMVPLLPVAAAVGWQKFRLEDHFPRVLLFMVGVSLAVGPVFLRNVIQGEDAVLITAHGGVNLWIGNNPEADGFFKTPRGSGLAGGQESLVSSSIRVAEKSEGRRMKPSQASDWWEARAMRFILGSPTRSLPLLAKKTVIYFNRYEKPLESNYHFGKTYSRVLRSWTVGLGLVLPLGLFGIWALRRRWRHHLALYVYIGVYSASVILFFVSMRYRLPVMVGMLPFAGAGLVQLLDWLRARELKSLGVGLAVLAGFIAATSVPLAAANIDHDLAHTEYLLGNLARDKGDEAVALQHYERAVTLYPEWSGFYNNLALTYLGLERPKEALQALDTAVKLGGNDRRIQRNRAKALIALGEDSQAAEAYLAALKRSPGHVPTLLDLAQVLARLGRRDEASGMLRQALEHTRDPAQRARIEQGLLRLEAPAGGDGTAAGATRVGSSSPPTREESTEEGDPPEGN